MEQTVAGSVEYDFFAKLAKNLDFDPFDLDAALIFDGPMWAQESGPLVAKMGMKKPARLGQNRVWS
jgi:hypothetical protein